MKSAFDIQNGISDPIKDFEASILEFSQMLFVSEPDIAGIAHYLHLLDIKYYHANKIGVSKQLDGTYSGLKQTTQWLIDKFKNQ